jgi:short-subunit dehydrogenase
MKRFDGRVAVVTGAGSGVGRATALCLARKGCRLALVDVNAAALEEVAKQLELSGTPTSTHLVDVSDAERMQALPAQVVAEHEAVHILVNNAGVSVSATFEDHSLDDLRWIVGINFWGVVHGCKFFLPLLKQADEAHIVNISSMFGFIGVPTQSSYCATKFAVKGLSEALWMELQGTHVGVTSIHPGGIRTGIARTMRSYDDEVRAATQAGLERSRPPEVVAKAILRAIEKNKLRAIVGWEAYATDWLKRLLPVRTHHLIARRMNSRSRPQPTVF